jgi:hypothetical protein
MTVDLSRKTTDPRIRDLENALSGQRRATDFVIQRINELTDRLDALYAHLGLEYKTIPSNNVVVAKAK